MRNAIVTGGSRGIGRAAALALAKDGCNILISYISNDEAAEKTAAEVRALGVTALLFKGDVSDFSVAEQVVKKCKDELGSVDVLVNNAGITRDRKSVV